MITPNPWLLLAILLALIGVGGEGYYVGHKHGVQAQQIADADALQQVRDEIASNKQIANAAIKKNDDDIIALEQARDQFKTKLYTEHQDHVQTTDLLHTALDAVRLSYVRDGLARSGPGGSDQAGAEGNPSGNDVAARVELPDGASRFLLTQAYACDKLADDYRMLFKWANSAPN